jgi:hypothetical protein
VTLPTSIPDLAGFSCWGIPTPTSAKDSYRFCEHIGEHIALERGASNCYLACMQFEIVRRLFVIVLSVALATGFAMRSGQAVAMDLKTAAPAAATMTTDMGMPASGKCIGCAGTEKAMASAACSAFCGSAMALLSVLVAFSPVCVDTIEPSVAAIATGHAILSPHHC